MTIDRYIVWTSDHLWSKDSSTDIFLGELAITTQVNDTSKRSTKVLSSPQLYTHGQCNQMI